MPLKNLRYVEYMKIFSVSFLKQNLEIIQSVIFRNWYNTAETGIPTPDFSTDATRAPATPTREQARLAALVLAPVRSARHPRDMQQAELPAFAKRTPSRTPSYEGLLHSPAIEGIHYAPQPLVSSAASGRTTPATKMTPAMEAQLLQAPVKQQATAQDSVSAEAAAFNLASSSEGDESLTELALVDERIMDAARRGRVYLRPTTGRGREFSESALTFYTPSPSRAVVLSKDDSTTGLVFISGKDGEKAWYPESVLDNLCTPSPTRGTLVR